MRRNILFLLIVIFALLPSLGVENPSPVLLSIQYDTSGEDYYKVGFLSSKEVVKDFTSVTATADNIILKVDILNATSKLYAVNTTPLYLYTQMFCAKRVNVKIYLEAPLSNEQDTTTEGLDWYIAFADDGTFTSGYGSENALIIGHMEDNNILRLGSRELKIRTADISSIAGLEYKGYIVLETEVVE